MKNHEWIEPLDPVFSVCKVEDYSAVNVDQPFCFTGRTDEEKSLVCPADQVPENTIRREDGWRAFRICGELDFSLIGVLARISKILADHRIGIFAISTFNTDYILMKEDRFETALSVLKNAGYRIVRTTAENGEEAAVKTITDYLFRIIRQEEAEQAVEIETICFPPHEACKREHMIPRIAAAADFFWVAEDRTTGKIAGFINGIATNETVFRDDFFTDASLHDPKGTNILILGLDVLPEYRGQGLARKLVSSYAERNRGKRLVLTCLEQLVPMYEKFGFRDLGESASVWGGERWREMDLDLR